MRKIAILASFLVPILVGLSGCAAVAVGVGAGLVISQNQDNNTYETRLNYDVKKVWPLVKQTLSDASLETIEIDEDVRLAKAKIDGSSVTVSCEAFDLDKTVMRVSARKYGGTLNDGEMASLMQEKILRRLEASK
jgi:hypothetical protein